MNNIHIYCDGAYSSSRTMMGYAFVVIQDNEGNLEKIYSDYDSLLGGTNNRAEIYAALEAIKWAKKVELDSFTIITDSMYVIGCANRGWKRKKNVDLWIEMDEAITGLTIEWKHVKGHSGDKWNEHCDVLAQHASQIC